MLNITNCPICEAIDLRDYLICKDQLVSHKEFKLSKCNACNLIFTNPIPPIDKLGEYYKSEEYISHSDTKKGIINRLYHAVRSVSVQKKWKLIESYVSRGTILDYGCGTGHFLMQANSKNWNCFGLEPDAGARAIASSKINEVFETLTACKQTFDVITLWHVLEHIPQLKQQVRNIIQQLNSKGIIVIAVPNPKSYDAIYYGSDWAAYDVPRHLYHFNQSNIIYLFQSFGLSHLKTIGMPADSFYVSLLTEQRRKNIWALPKAFCLGLISNIKAQFTSEYSSLIYIFKKP